MGVKGVILAGGTGSRLHPLTRITNAYVDRGLMEYDVIDGFWGDAGESIDVYYEVVDHVRKHDANLIAPSSTSAQQVTDRPSIAAA
jgi:hypothetical protein